ncbi:DUF2207 domain-containing protein [Candidatus Micrarchaeota archaeon]|nr:DUF2207 domain-containing protein [Candidatus Micrarchaeota archaeon]
MLRMQKSSPLVLVALMLAIFCLPLSFAFTIDSYYSEAWVLPNGDLAVYEDMVFTLEQQYSEGYRSIRAEDYGSDLGNLVLHGAKLNGNAVSAHTQVNGEAAEIVWERTTTGKNKVELNYTLKNVAESFDDFARVCYEHYGANWAVSARSFESVMHLPESTRGTEVHFEVYSGKVGEAYAEGTSIVIGIDNVPSGNYVGGCYLFNNSAISASKHVEGSALQILEDERESYGSHDLDSGAPITPVCCCPVALVLLAFCIYLVHNYKAPPNLPENILPPSTENPAAVSVLLRATYDEKEILAATILELINKGVLDIMELEKAGETSQEIKRERTILFLKKRPETLKKYENAVLDMIFAEGEKEVDLDALSERWKKISKKSEAKESVIPTKMEEFSKEIKAIIKRRGLETYQNSSMGKLGHVVGIGFFALFFSCALADSVVPLLESLGQMLAGGQPLEAYLSAFGLFGALILSPIAAYLYLRPSPPKGMEEEYGQWDSFRRAVNASSLKEEPPSGALIWGEILVYATALGIAKKVEKHLSELDTFLASRIRKMERVRESSFVLYGSALGVRNLSKYGNRSGFSSSSSGGWSSHGGGGFSGGHSGGGGFR